MSLKIFKPYTKSTRGTVLVDRKNLWKGKSLKSLTIGKHSTGGRNNLGRITSRGKGAGQKHKYREIDFYRKKDDLKAKIERIEYDPNRSAHLALIKYEDGAASYIVAPSKINIGDEIVSGRNKEIKIGNCMPLSDIPAGTDIHNLELSPNGGGKLARSAGSSAQILIGLIIALVFYTILLRQQPYDDIGEDQMQTIEEWKDMKAPEWYNQVGVNYPEMEKEKWSVDTTHIKLMAEEALEE